MSVGERVLPEGWAQIGMGAITEFVMGQAPPGSECNSSGEGTPFVKAGEFGANKPIIREWTTQPLKLARESDVLICVVGATAGKLNLGCDCAIGRSVAAIRPRTELISQKHLYQFLRTETQNLRANSVGSAQAVISRDDLANVQLSLSPLAEQKVIADKLDALLAQVDILRARLDAIPAILKRFRQSVLSAAVTGKLTEDWRPTIPNLPISRTVTLGEVIRVSSGTTLSAKNMAPDGIIPVYGGNGISGYHNQANRFKPSIVIGRVGFYCGCVHQTPEKSWVTDNALIVSYDRLQLDQNYLFWSLKAMNLRENDASTAQPVISGQKIYPLKFSLPPIIEQNEIVRRVESLFAFADQIEARTQEAAARVMHLTQSILAKAFRGELTEEWRKANPDLVSGENSAEALLGRIRATRANDATSTPRGRKPSARSTSSAPAETSPHLLVAEAPKRRGRPRKT